MDVVAHRRALHAIPELDRQLPETTGYVRQVLEGLSCKVFSPTEGSVCAYFDQGRETTLALRADMDALPVHLTPPPTRGSCTPAATTATRPCCWPWRSG